MENKNIIEDFISYKSIKEIAREYGTTPYNVKKIILSHMSKKEFDLILKKRTVFKRFKANIDYLDKYYDDDKRERIKKANLKRYHNNKLKK